MRNISGIFIFLLLVPGLTSCTFFRLATSDKLIPPEASYVSHDIKNVNNTDVTIDVHLKIKNKNKIGLRNIDVGYQASLDRKRLATGSNIRIDLKPDATTDLTVPVKIRYRDMMGILGVSAKHILLSSKTIPVNIDLTIIGAPTLYNEHESGSTYLSFSLTVSKTVDVPLPQDDINKAKKKAAREAKKIFKKLF